MKRGPGYPPQPSVRAREMLEKMGMTSERLTLPARTDEMAEMFERTRTEPIEADATERALARLRELVRKKGLNSSAIRDAIARAAVNFKGHFEVGDLVEAVGKSGVKGAHLATVYRALPLLIEAGVIAQTMLSAGERHFYESAFERQHHDHLVCEGCGTIIEFHSEAFEAMERELAARYDFELTSHVHELLGRCGKCRRKGGSPPNRRRARVCP